MIRRQYLVLVIVVLACLLPSSHAFGQFKSLETENLRLVYYGVASEYVVGHVARSFENSLAFHRERFDFTPSEKITVFLHDLNDYGNAAADVLPRNRIVVGMAPLNYSFETSPANERLNAAMHHEIMHVVANDKAAGRDRAFRRVFLGKVDAIAEDPVSILYSYLTAPRRYAPRWYQEGIAVFMETWMAGGLGRTLGGYDEMVFRTFVRDVRSFYRMVGLESEGTAVDFQVGVNSYLYGTRFMSYLAYKYGPDVVLRWATRNQGSKGHFTTAFKSVFGLPLAAAWSDWIAFEHEYQEENLARIRANPTTDFRAMSEWALGSVSRAHLSEGSDTLFLAVNFPGQVAHIAALEVGTGRMTRIVDVKGPMLFTVASLAHDRDAGVLFYTTDNNNWRDLRVVDLNDGTERTLIKDARVGDLSFDASDRSLWGVRHYLGISTLVRIPPPYDKWNQIRSWPYGQDLYDIDVSPDGRTIIGALAEISGRQTLIRLSVDSLLAGSESHETLFDFGVSNPESFVFTSDGRHLYGSSYYSGVSNIYRYDFEMDRMQVMSNCETGCFRPVPVSDDSLIVFRYTAQGFQPAMMGNEPVGRVSAIRFLGQEVVEAHPQVKSWMAGSPGSIDLEARTRSVGPYRGLRHLGIDSAYPIVQGYKDGVAIGVRLNFSDPASLHRLNVRAAFSPDPALPDDERLHAAASYSYFNWTADASYNGADFYDLFGPTKNSRKGYMVGIAYDRGLIYDPPRRTLDIRGRVAGYGGLERLPDYQNVAASYSELLSAGVTLNYENVRGSIGAIDREKGIRWSLSSSANYVSGNVFPRVFAEFHVGRPVPLRHASLWLSTYAGQSFGDRNDPFANFYFGGFGNNWVDHREEKRYLDYESLPGVDLNDVGGVNYGKALIELNLPPLRFQSAGGSSLYLKWARASVFTSGLVTNVDSAPHRRSVGSAGAQVDFRVMLFSYLRTTLSFGAAVAAEQEKDLRRELMVSLKIL